MSWLVSIVLAGMVFASDGNVPLQTNGNHIETNTAPIVKSDETERFEQTYPLTTNGKVSVSNVNGSIIIEAWDRNEVKLVAVKTADTREHLADLEIKIDARPDYLSIETDYDALRRRGNRNGQNKNYGKLEVEYHLTVPRAAVLDEIQAVNGSISVSNMTNFTKVSAVNGEVKAFNLSGTADISTVNGTVEADFGSLQAGSRISLTTVNGRANLVIPSDADATIKADTVNGSIVNDFGLPVRKGQYIGRNLYGRIGTGDVKIKLESVNGELAVRRKQDGRNPHPATNLLQQKSTNNSDDEDNFDDESITKTTNKSIKEAIKAARIEMPEINIEVEKALAEAQKEIAKAKININSKEMKAQIEQAMERQKEEFARMREAGWFSGSPSIEKKTGSFAVRGTPKVTIDAKDCAVLVRGWDKPEVSYAVTQFSRVPNQTPLQIKADHTDSEVNIKVTDSGGTTTRERGNFFGIMSRARIEIFVPKKSNLRILTDKEIRLENVSGDIDLQGADEAVNVRDADGKLSVATGDGRIRVIGFRGAFDGKTDSGMMNLEGDFQSFNAETTDGTIVLTLPENTDALLEANTEIENDGLNLIRDNANAKFWRTGSGGKGSGIIYRMNAPEGKVIVRGANRMISVLQ